MVDIQNKGYCPLLEEIGEYVNNPVFNQFCAEVKTKYKCKEKIEFSSCSWEYGWNVKFKRRGKAFARYILKMDILLCWLLSDKKKNRQLSLFCINVHRS